jgi:hypothetical protein
MASDDRERIQKAYARLVGLQEGLKPSNSGYVDETQGRDFNKALDHLVAAGFDIDEFRLEERDFKDMQYMGTQVLWDTLITRLHAVMAYFTVKVTEAKNAEDPPTRKIGFEGPRR